jgi:hypothetical protein
MALVDFNGWLCDEGESQQRFMAERADVTIVEVAASHVSFLSQPEAATQLILQAVEATAAARH